MMMEVDGASRVEDSLSAFSAAAGVITATVDTLSKLSSEPAVASKGVRAFVSLKAAGRGACLAISAVRDTVADRKAGLDEKQTELEGLLYRNHRLREEVQSCRDYPCRGLARILSETELAPLFDGEDHGRKLAALLTELEARKRAATEKIALAAKKTSIEKTIEADGASLAKLKPLLSTLVNSAMKPLREALNRPVKRRRVETPELPRPLYLIYSQLDACHASVFPASTVEIVNQSVVLTVAGATRVVFAHSSAVDLVTVECWRGGAKQPYFLEALFPGATTEISPAVAHAALDAGVSAAFEGGYDWAQWIAGLSAPRSEGRLEPSCRLVCTAIRDRIEAQEALEAQLVDLSKRPHPIATAPGWFTSESGGRLVSLTESKGEKKRGCRYVTAVFEGQQVDIEIAPDYPTTPPRFSVEIGSSSELLVDEDSRNWLLSHQLRSILDGKIGNANSLGRLPYSAPDPRAKAENRA